MINKTFILLLVTLPVSGMNLGDPHDSFDSAEQIEQQRIIKQAEKKHIEACRIECAREEQARRELRFKFLALYESMHQKNEVAQRLQRKEIPDESKIVTTFDESFDILSRPGAISIKHDWDGSTRIELTPATLVSLSNLFKKKTE